MKQTNNISLMGIFLALMIVGAYIQITLPTPFFVMHITLQFFVSILVGLCLPFNMATCIMAIYILMGLCGIPVFASGGGIYYLVKPTFGFVLGFLFASMICSYGANKRTLESFKDYFIEGLKGLAIFYLSGNIYYFLCTRLLLKTMVPLPVMFFNCFVVSIIPDIFLCYGACICAQRLKPLFKKRGLV